MNYLRNNRIAKFVAIFFVVFGAMYCINYLLIGLMIPGGYYSAWLAKHMDYVAAYRTLILKGAGMFTSMFGFESYVNKYELHLPGISAVRMVYSCIGFDVLCFWVAFATAYPQQLKKKLFYAFAGIVCITMLNMIRVGALAMIRAVKGLRYMQIDHHFIFNIVVYLLIFLMIRKMLSQISKSTAENAVGTSI